jgi:hypothetical protein
MRTLGSGTSSAINAAVTAPRYLVEILFSSPWRITSSGNVITWNGNTWQPWDVAISGLDLDGQQVAQSGAIKVGDTDNTATALVNGQGVADRRINVWKFYGDANPAAGDPVQLFAGVGDSVDWATDGSSLTIKLEQGGAMTLFSPRFYLTPANGFDDLPPPGTLISWNGEQIELQSEQ